MKLSRCGETFVESGRTLQCIFIFEIWCDGLGQFDKTDFISKPLIKASQKLWETLAEFGKERTNAIRDRNIFWTVHVYSSLNSKRYSIDDYVCQIWNPAHIVIRKGDQNSKTFSIFKQLSYKSYKNWFENWIWRGNMCSKGCIRTRHTIAFQIF